MKRVMLSTVVAMFSLLFVLTMATPASSAVEDDAASMAGGECSCLGARHSTQQCSCGTSGEKKPAHCWEKMVLASSPARYCGKLCESCYNVCANQNRNENCH